MRPFPDPEFACSPTGRKPPRGAAPPRRRHAARTHFRRELRAFRRRSSWRRG